MSLGAATIVARLGDQSVRFPDAGGGGVAIDPIEVVYRDRERMVLAFGCPMDLRDAGVFMRRRGSHRFTDHRAESGPRTGRFVVRPHNLLPDREYEVRAVGHLPKGHPVEFPTIVVRTSR